MITNNDYENKTFYVFGLGKTGIATIKTLLASNAVVYAWDDKVNKETLPVQVLNSLREPKEINWSSLDYLVLSPGVPLHFPEPHQVVKEARNNNVTVISDIEILYESTKSSRFIGVTGTNGKSTTTSLIYHVLKNSGINCQVGGNIGIPVLELEKFNSNGSFVLELSSFQLDLLRNVKFNIAILLNITKDHLDRHGSMENYIESKTKIFAHQNVRDWAIINVDNHITRKIYESFGHSSKKVPISTERVLDKGVAVLPSKIVFNLHDHKGEIIFSSSKNLPGAHNRENIAAAFAVGLIYNISPQTIINQVLRFVPLEHRMEYVGTINDVEYYNDSKATNAEASIAALSSFKNIYWIVGGVAKEGGIEGLVPYFPNISKAYLIGDAATKFTEVLIENNINHKISHTLEQAFIDAKQDAERAQKPAYIMLSPACASYDQFKNFEERGNKFKSLFNLYNSRKS